MSGLPSYFEKVIMKPYYETKLGKLYHGHCCDIIPGLPVVDLTVTSPPYDDLRNYKGFDFDFKRTARALFKQTKPGGAVVWVVSDQTDNGSETGTSFKQALYFKYLGFNLHDTMLFKKNLAPLNHNRYEQEFEYMFVFSKGKPKTFNPIRIPCRYFGEKRDSFFSETDEPNRRLRSVARRKSIKSSKIKGNIWEYQVGSNKSTKDKIAFEHPAIFPESLAQDHILSWSDPGDTILDPMCGSGTTPKMCEVNNRKWLACEISEEYCEIAAKRIQSEAGDLKLCY